MRRFRPLRVVLITLGVAAAAFAALVVATNVALRSDWLVGQLDADPSTLFVTFARPRSFFPGRLRFDTLTLRSRDSNIEWEARLEDVSVHVSLADLLSRRFHATSVRAAGLTFRLRERLESAEATPARASRYPRIAGFADPPLRDPPAALPDPGNPWRIVVSDLFVGDVREIWIDSWRWTGSSHLRGGFMLLPGREAEVAPSELAVALGELRFGGADVSRKTSGTVSARLPRFDTQAYPGNAVWKIISGRAALEGSLEGLEFLSADGEGARFEGGKGTARVRVGLSAGRGAARVDADARGLAVRANRRVLRGSARVEVKATLIDFHEGGASLSGTRVALSGLSIDGRSGEGWGGVLAAPEAHLKLTDGALDARLLARLGDGRPLAVLLPEGPPKWVAGLFDLRNFEARGRVVRAPGRFTISDAHISSGSFELSGDFREKGRLGWGALLVRKGVLSLGVGFRSNGTALHLLRASEWFEREAEPGGLRTDQPRDGELIATRRSM